MKLSTEILLNSFFFLVAYCYTIMKAHFLLSKIDKKFPIPKCENGMIRLKVIKAWNEPGLNEYSPDLKASILLLTLNDGIVLGYFAFLLCALFLAAK